MESAILTRIRASYQADLRRLTVRRLHVGAAVFLLFGVVVSMLEYAYFPERWAVLASVYGAYAAVCAAALATLRAWPSQAMRIATLASLLLIAAMSSYHVATRTNSEMFAVTLALYCIATTIVLPWGAAGQALTSAAATVAFGTVAGDRPTSWPLPYEIIALAGVGFLTTLHAYFAADRRWLSYRDEAEARVEAAQLRATAERAQHELALINTRPVQQR